MEENMLFRCPKCIEKGRDGHGAPSRYKAKIKGGLLVTVCIDCAVEDAKASIEANGSILRYLHGLAEGETKERVGQIASLFKPEVADVYSGKAPGMRGRGSFVRAQDRASDLVALARLTLARSIIGKAKAAYQQALEQKESFGPRGEKLFAILEHNLAYGEQELSKAWALVGSGDVVDPTKPTQMRSRERRALWGMASRAFSSVHGLATSFGRLAAGQQYPADSAMRRIEQLFGGREKMKEFFELQPEEKTGVQDEELHGNSSTPEEAMQGTA